MTPEELIGLARSDEALNEQLRLGIKLIHSSCYEPRENQNELIRAGYSIEISQVSTTNRGLCVLYSATMSISLSTD